MNAIEASGITKAYGLFGRGQRVVHVVEILDEAYRNYREDARA